MKLIVVVMGVLLTGVMGAADFSAAMEPTKLPAFAIQSAGGEAVSSEHFSVAAKWLLVYVPADCPHCQNLLGALEPIGNAGLADRVIVIVRGASADGLSGLAREKLSALRWYADPDDQAYKALSILSTPTVYGVRDGVMEWSVVGSMAADRALLIDWLRK